MSNKIIKIGSIIKFHTNLSMGWGFSQQEKSYYENTNFRVKNPVGILLKKGFPQGELMIKIFVNGAIYYTVFHEKEWEKIEILT